jgi:hypothetical protein
MDTAAERFMSRLRSVDDTKNKLATSQCRGIKVKVSPQEPKIEQKRQTLESRPVLAVQDLELLSEFCRDTRSPMLLCKAPLDRSQLLRPVG